EKPTLILLDLNMPDMNGYMVCKAIREIPEFIHTPVIMFTASANESNEIKGFQAGVDDYMAKPFKPRLLLARIQTAIGRNKSKLEANALSHLPGNTLIFQEIESRIKSKKKFSVFYMDLNDFKAFNDRYGFLHGDAAIQLSADILSRCFKSS